MAPGTDVAALSIPRGGNGKSFLAAHILQRCLTPGDPLHVAGSEYLLCAASIEQARLVYRFIRAELDGDPAYRLVDSTTRLGITHLATNTRLRVLSSNGKTAFGIVNCGILVADEPGSWETVGGTLMYDAIVTALGKPGSPMKALFIGTLSPSLEGWWHNLVNDGSGPTTYIQALTTSSALCRDEDRKGARSMASSLPKVHSTPRVHPGTWLVVSWMGVYARVVYGCQPESHKKQGNGERPPEMGRRHARRPYDGDGFRGFPARA